MKLLDLLELSVFGGSRVVAGHNGLCKEVKSVNMMDAPDIIDFLKPDELLLTTGYAIREKPEEMLQLVRRMAAQQCAGLGIKTKRFLKEIPEDVLRLADSLQFPLIELSLDYSLGEMLGESLSYIMEKRNEELRSALHMHREFSRMVMKGQGLASIVEALSHLIGRTVLLVDYRLQILAVSRELEGSFQRCLFHEMPHFLSARPDYDTSTWSLCFFQSDGSGEGRVHPRQHQEVTFYPIELPQHPCYLVLIHTLGQHQAPSELPALAIEQAANVIGFELMKQQAVKEKSRRYKNDFFEDLLEGRFLTSSEIARQGSRYGLADPYPCICVAGRIDDAGGAAGENLYGKRDHIYEVLKAFWKEKGLTYVRFMQKDLFIFLINWARDGVLHEFQLAELLLAVQGQLYETEQVSISFGIGNPVETLTAIPATYKEAVRALQLGRQLKLTRFVQSYRTKEVMELLQLIPKSALQDFYRETFEALMGVEEQERKDLMNTARVFLETQCQITETAKRLFIHRNTVQYRIHKYEQLTRRNLRDPNDSMRFRVAFLIDNLQ